MKPMTDLQLFDTATWWAEFRERMLAGAAGKTPTTYTRRQCLALARKAEKHIVFLAVTAELRCGLDVMGGRRRAEVTR